VLLATVAIGSHDAIDEAQIASPETLARPAPGQASVPTTAGTSRYWDRPADNFNRWGAAASRARIKLYQAQSHTDYNFVLAPVLASMRTAKPTGGGGGGGVRRSSRVLEYDLHPCRTSDLAGVEIASTGRCPLNHRYQSVTYTRRCTTPPFRSPRHRPPALTGFPSFSTYKDGCTGETTSRV